MTARRKSNIKSTLARQNFYDEKSLMQPKEHAGICRSRPALVLLLFSLVGIFAAVATPSAIGQETISELPKEKQTALGLYVTAAEAYEMWKAAPDGVKVIDVRTPEEYAFVGHAEMAWNIPVAFVTYQRKDGKTEHGAKMNPNFVAEVKRLAGPTDTLLVMCRSGGRSAMAVNQLASAGFKNVFNITDGMEGDKVEDPGSVFLGKRMRNGWKNSAPWTYGIDPERIILAEGASKQTKP
ncbi:rhodanese-like domain-containing protein [Novipirellula artificiosorum]|uniref:Molybdopterin biosynthesis protein MoeB n=1 Tax=Novipirellula artificiosorum TaxID=2528016 RepID=A0A5C6D0Y8_9BACT|nr:rhodanese-like domain-containing protein [Novipirellula artificiosorum]TWU30813.1 molybdopterin biosynthesis protein MoeB [Novipirellula artificiosorum]